MLKSAFAGLVLSISSFANAGLIVEYDFSTATSSTTLDATFVEADYLATGLALNNPSNSATSFGNHFYHNGWDSTFNANKYYETSISSSNSFSLSSLSFALENLSGTSSYWLRSSLDGYNSNLSNGSFTNGLVTDFSVDLSTLGVINSPITFRWFIASSGVAGFANHECGGVATQGCGLEDVGQDLQFFGQTSEIPEPSTLAIFALGIMGLVSRRFKKL